MVRVCMVAYTHYSTDNRVRREAEALVDRGDQVDIIGLKTNGEGKLIIFNGVRVHQISLGRYRGSNTFLYLISYLLFFIAASMKLILLHIKHPYQVIQVHTMPDFMVFTALFPKLLGAKVIIDVHDLMPELYQSKFGLHKGHPIIRLITWAERCSIGFAHRAIAVHQPHLDALCQHGNPSNKFTLLFNLPDEKIFANLASTPTQVHPGLELIYHGTLAKRNGLEIAIRAISVLEDDLKQVTMKIFGIGEDFSRLIELVRELGLKDRVQIEGTVPLEKLAPVIQAADIGIVPILYDHFTKYMLPVKLLEYVFMGKPVICSRTETIETYFNDDMVRFVSPGDVYELAGAIRELYEHPERRKQLSTAASQFTREYRWEKQKLTYYQLIDGLVKS